jgi:hypothetical protein
MIRTRAALLLIAAGSAQACTRVPPPPPAAALPDPGALATELVATTTGLRPRVVEQALAAYLCAAAQGKVGGDRLLIIDYELPSTDERLWLVDLAAARVLRRELVAHGKGSGENLATRFSNDPRSHQSSLGLYRVLDAYQGKHGLSLRLRGLEPGTNDNAERRSIVIHGADYVSAEFAARHRRLGRSWGCPALSLAAHRSVIEALTSGNAVFIWGDDATWRGRSPYLHCRAAGD